MALASARQYFNAVREQEEIANDYAKTFLLLAPNMIVRERLKGDFASRNIFPRRINSRQRFYRRIAARKGNLLVINDEVHHTRDEGSKWTEVIQNLHKQRPITAQLDFSTTPRFQKGAILPWTISDYPPKQAIWMEL